MRMKFFYVINIIILFILLKQTQFNCKLRFKTLKPYTLKGFEPMIYS
jgi:hypothetical protein